MKRLSKRRILLLNLLMVGLVGLAACQGAASPVVLVTRLPPQLITATPSPTSIPPTPTLTPTATITPSPTATHISLRSIAYLRQREYPGSDITIEQTLAPG